jgi:hypothetical protein
MATRLPLPWRDTAGGVWRGSRRRAEDEHMLRPRQQHRPEQDGVRSIANASPAAKYYEIGARGLAARALLASTPRHLEKWAPTAVVEGCSSMPPRRIYLS